jgi:hypothetical protein
MKYKKFRILKMQNKPNSIKKNRIYKNSRTKKKYNKKTLIKKSKIIKKINQILNIDSYLY